MSNFKLRQPLFAAVFLGMILVSGSAQADISPASKEEIKEKAKQVLEYLEKVTAAAAKQAGEKPNPVVGPLMTLLLESDHLICDSWLLNGHLVLRNLLVADADPELINRAQQLLWRVERACAEEGSDSEPNKPAPKKPGLNKPSGPPDGPGAFHPRPGWTIAQEICARKCSDPYAAYLAAIRFAERIQDNADTAKQRADEALADAQSGLRKANDELAKAKKRLDAANKAIQDSRDEAKRKGVEVSVFGASYSDQVAAQTDARKDVNTWQSAVSRFSRDMAQVATSRTEAQRIADAARRARIQVDAAFKAYNDCISSCGPQTQTALQPRSPIKPKINCDCDSFSGIAGKVDGVACRIQEQDIIRFAEQHNGSIAGQHCSPGGPNAFPK